MFIPAHSFISCQCVCTVQQGEENACLYLHTLLLASERSEGAQSLFELSHCSL